jgi:hypothetical protein
MNIGQKILTAIFLIVFVLGTGQVASQTYYQYYVLQNCFIVWVVIGVVYAGLFFIFKKF